MYTATMITACDPNFLSVLLSAPEHPTSDGIRGAEGTQGHPRRGGCEGASHPLPLRRLSLFPRATAPDKTCSNLGEMPLRQLDESHPCWFFLSKPQELKACIFKD